MCVFTYVNWLRSVEEGKMASSSMVGGVDDIVVNVDFHRRLEQSSIFASEVQVVPGNIAWEDLELMVRDRDGFNDRLRKLRSQKMV